MQVELVKRLCDCLSENRLYAYRTNSCETQSDILCRYLWNVALCQAFYPVLHMHEVGLRNRCDLALTIKYGSAWLETGSFGFMEYQKNCISDARNELAKRTKPRDHGRLVAELHFGFWTSLFNREFEGRWHGVLRHAFPHLSGSMRTRATIAKRLDSIRRFRNRVFHHERILHHPFMAIHRELREAIDWMGSEFSAFCSACDQVKTAYAAGPRRMMEPLNGAFPEHGFR